MNILIERKVAQCFRKLLGDEIWDVLSREKKLALLELVNYMMINAIILMNGSRLGITPEEIDEFVQIKLKVIQKEELMAVLRGKSSGPEFSDFGIDSNLGNKPGVIATKRKKLDMEVLKLKNISFTNPELEKRRLQIIEAVEGRVSIPADELDLYVISRVVPEVMDAEEVKKMEDWLDQEYASGYGFTQIVPKENSPKE